LTDYLIHCLPAAVLGGNLEIVKDINEQCKTCICDTHKDLIMYNAAIYNNFELLEYGIEIGADDFSHALNGALSQCITSKKTIQLLLEKGKAKFHKSEYVIRIKSAKSKEILQLILPYTEKCFSQVEYEKAIYDIRYDVRHIQNTFDVEFPSCMNKYVGPYGLFRNVVMFKYMINNGEINVNEVFKYVVHMNNMDLVKFLLEKGATDFRGALQYAILSHNTRLTILQLILYRGRDYLRIEDYVDALFILKIHMERV
jgi:hypothetical protein